MASFPAYLLQKHLIAIFALIMQPYTLETTFVKEMSLYLTNYLSSTERRKYRDGQARSAVHRWADHRYQIRHCACSLAVIMLCKLCHLSETISLMYSIWQMTHLCDITYSPAKIGTSSMKACSLRNDIAFRVHTPHIPHMHISQICHFSQSMWFISVYMRIEHLIWRWNKALIEQANN